MDDFEAMFYLCIRLLKICCDDLEEEKTQHLYFLQ